MEARGFRDLYPKFKSQKVPVLGVSPDTPAAQTKFKEKFDLNFPLLCDVERRMAADYGVLKEKNMYGKTVMGIERTTFLIDGEGKIQKIFPKVKPDGHAEEVLAELGR